MDLSLVGRGLSEYGRDLYLARLGALEEWPAAVDLGSRYFTLFLAMDARPLPEDSITEFARTLLDQGLAALDAWGPESDRVHTLFDLAKIDKELASGLPTPFDLHVMTNSWEKETLCGSLWFAVISAWPSPGFEEGWRSRLAIVVDQPEWADQVERWLSDLQLLDEDAAAEDD